MKNLLVPACAVLLAASVALGGEVKSGLEPGAFPGAFNVKDVTGPEKGKSLCYRCRYGDRPVVSIFARELDDSTVNLIKQVDQKVGQNKDAQLSAFVVLLTDNPEAAEKKLQEIAQKNKIQNVPLTVFDGTAGPPAYKISEKADVTVLMWNKSNVKVNHALPEGELDKAKVTEIVKDTDKILK